MTLLLGTAGYHTLLDVAAGERLHEILFADALLVVLYGTRIVKTG
jgi:hypothetical protein